MSKLNPQNERIKRDYLRHMKQACGKSEATYHRVAEAAVYPFTSERNRFLVAGVALNSQ